MDNCGENGEKVEGDRGNGRENRGRKPRKNKVFHKLIHSVEKVRRENPQTVEKRENLCYNGDMAEKTPDFERIYALFEKNRAAFERFYELLLQYNERYNLTAITQKEEVIHKHFLDSLAGEHLFPQGTAAVEIGSGAGFPSLPLKIVRPDLSLTLIESTGKKCEFLRAAVRELGLDGVTVLNTRAEDAGKGTLREKFDAAFARAVAPLASLAEYCMPLVRVGGQFIAYKGAADELAGGRKAIATLGGGEAERVCYELPADYGARSLIVVGKIRPTPLKYPRGQGKERSAPIA